jgi:putative thioredoxin
MMSGNENSFGGAGGQYTVSFGDEPQTSAPGANGAVSAGDLIKDTTTASFAVDVIQESRNQPVLVDFWAPWCGPCKQLTPVIEKSVLAAKGKVKLVKMNIDEHPAIAGQLGIQSIPAVIAFKDGQPVDGFMGAVPESQINEFIGKLGGKDAGAAVLEEALAAAAEARAAGDTQGAASIYDSILAQQPDNLDAISGLADLLFEAGDKDGARELLGQAGEGAEKHAGLIAVQAKLALDEQASSLGDPAEMERRLAADPKDHQARFDLAMIQNAQGKREEAADNLLAIVRADREWHDDGARNQLLAFFEAWGMTDDATLSARRKLSSLLFS